MSLTMYQVTVPGFLFTLDNFIKILDKVNGDAAEKGIDIDHVLNEKANPKNPGSLSACAHMRLACHTARVGLSKLADLEFTRLEPQDLTFRQLRDEIVATEAFIKALPLEKIIGTENKRVVSQLGQAYAGQFFAINYLLPRFHFHFSLAFSQLVRQGFELKRAEYLGVEI